MANKDFSEMFLVAMKALENLGKLIDLAILNARAELEQGAIEQAIEDIRTENEEYEKYEE